MVYGIHCKDVLCPSAYTNSLHNQWTVMLLDSDAGPICE